MKIKLKYEELRGFKDTKFKRLIGVKREIFEFQVAILEDELKEKHKHGGRPPKLATEDILLLMYGYLRDYTTFLKLGMYFGIDESNAYRWIIWAESVLNSYMTEDFDISKLDRNKEYFVDVTECAVERPVVQEVQREYYSGKKKKHTMKIQLIIEENFKRIVYVAFNKGSVHDFTLFKESTTNLDRKTNMLADSGYQGLDKILPKSLIPKKKSKFHPLTDQDKDLNHLISTIRISIEHVNRQLKIFRILQDCYRNRKVSFPKRALFLCSLYNFP